MKNIFTTALLIVTSFSFAQAIPSYQNRANKVTPTNINNILTEFENLGKKTTGSTQNSLALTWLKNKYLSYGYVAGNLVEHSWTNGGYTSKNLIVTKTGTGANASKFIIVCGHFDTVNGAGTNDNGSGISVILELARILQSVSTDYSIKFINFSGEEQGLLGSKAYVASTLAPTVANTLFVLNIDEIGGVTNKENNAVTCESDQTTAFGTTGNNTQSLTLTTKLAEYIVDYSAGLSTIMSNAYASDYMPFEAKGHIITGLFEGNETTHKHTSTDLKINMDPDYVVKIGKGLVGAMQHFAVAAIDNTLDTNDVNSKDLKQRVSLYPNPASDFLNVGVDGKIFNVLISDYSGKIVMQSRNSQNLDISKLVNGSYLLTVTIDGQSTTKKFIIKK